MQVQGHLRMFWKSLEKSKQYGQTMFFESSRRIYNLNFPDHTFHQGDLMLVEPKDIPQHDIITGGFPCQQFSLAGKKLGFADERSNVFWKIIDIMKYHQPKIVVLENVKNLMTHDKGETLQTVLDALTGEGYCVHHKLLDTDKFTGIPQHRERIYLVCIRKDLDLKFIFPDDIEDSGKKSLTTFYEAQPKSTLYYTDKLKVYDKIKEAVVKENTVYQYRRHYVRENKSGVVPTLTANMGQGGHNVPLIKDMNGIRKLSPRECFSFQGFPNTYKLDGLSDTQLYALAGNAVTVAVIERLLENLLCNF